MLPMHVDINGLRSLDGEVEWEWKCGSFDYHLQYDVEVGSWVLERFRSNEPDSDKAHEAEQECESLADALLFSIGEAAER
jgi:hypothetical protein